MTKLSITKQVLYKAIKSYIVFLVFDCYAFCVSVALYSILLIFFWAHATDGKRLILFGNEIRDWANP